jgi:hypothetical protein
MARQKNPNVLHRMGTGIRLLFRTIAQPHYFHPYSVWVVPKISRLLLDFKLLKDAGEYARLERLWEETETAHSADIWFTVLQPDEQYSPGLIYSEDRQSFVTRIDFSECIEGIEFRRFENPLRDQAEEAIVFKDDISLAQGPAFSASSLKTFFRRREVDVGIIGSGREYEMGIGVSQEWWDRTGAKTISKGATQIESETTELGETQLVLARLPILDFESLFRQGRLQQNRHQREGREKRLAHFGWESVGPSWWTRERLEEYAFLFQWACLEHKYFIVGAREI